MMAPVAAHSESQPFAADESRRYRILEVVGEGGFGKVYRARLEGAEGFAKDVAIKLLSDDQAPPIVLQRFRDESRILGLVRDRAVITVDPPTRLEGRWAVVMEFVDGTNCQRLLRESPLPPRTALEVVQEVARALDNVYHQEGPDGAPLHLVHRDIKPGNIQLTPAGTVKVLDFGIARAEFAARESKTTTHIGGTFGYIAPERLHGDEGPASDVYSLGVVLKAIVAGRRPTAKNRAKIEAWVAGDPDVQRVWALAEEMTRGDPEERPTAREVEDRAAAMGPTVRGEPLRRWAEQHVKSYKDLEPDGLIGNVLTETMAHVPRFADSVELPATRTRRRVWPWVAAVVVTLLLIASAVGAVSVAGVGVFLAGVGLGDAPPPQTTAVVPVAGPPPVDPVVPPEEPLPPAEPAPVQGPALPPPEPAPAPPPEPRPPRVTPQPKVATHPVSLSSIPIGAKVYVDGRPVGKTPLMGHALPEGRHRVRMTLPDGSNGMKTIVVGPDEPAKYVWQQGGDTWLVRY
jgi:serine/threonine-protein kinase